MAPPPATAYRQPDDREGLSPSPEPALPGIATIADLLDEDDDDMEFQPSTEQSENSDVWEEDDDPDGDEYVGIVRDIGN